MNYAVDFGNIEVVRYLINHVNPNIQDKVFFSFDDCLFVQFLCAVLSFSELISL